MPAVLALAYAGLLLVPLALVVLHTALRQEVPVAPRPPVDFQGSVRTCPDCAEIVLRQAAWCKHCGFHFGGR